MAMMVLIAPEFGVSPPLEALWLAELPHARREQLSRGPDERARHRSLIGSRLLAHGLRRLGATGAVLATLRYPPRSRPLLDGSSIDFSLSHCEGRIACALSTQGRVGLDVEALGGMRATDFHLYLSADERAWAGRSTRRFYTVWTRKEAVVKAASERGLQDVARVYTMPGGDATFDDQRWQTLRVPAGRHHVAHLAAAQLPREVQVRRLSPAVLERDTPVAGFASVR